MGAQDHTRLSYNIQQDIRCRVEDSKELALVEQDILGAGDRGKQKLERILLFEHMGDKMESGKGKANSRTCFFTVILLTFWPKIEFTSEST